MNANPLWLQIEQNLTRQHGFEPLTVEGTIPAHLEGTLYRNGPALFERFGQRYPHSFFGDGAISAVRIARGQAWGAVKLVQTPQLKQEERAGRHLYGPCAPWPLRLYRSLSQRDKNPTNVNVIAWQDQLWALPELGSPVRMDARSLETLSAVEPEDLSLQLHTAHPHVVAARGELLTYRVSYGRAHEVEVLAVDRSHAWRSLGKLKMPGPCYLHDFIATERYAIFFFTPARLDLTRALLQWGSFEDLIQWRDDASTLVGVLDLEAPTKPRWYELPPQFAWHFANAHQRGDALIIDYIKHQDLSSLTALSLGEQAGQGSPQPTLERVTLPLNAATPPTSTTLAHIGGDFPQLRACDLNCAQPYTWALTQDQQRAGIARYDHATAQLDHYRCDPAELPSEALYIEAPSDSPQRQPRGHLISLIYDARCHKSYAAIFHAGAVSDGPIAKLWFDHHIPLTFHGSWVGGQAH